MFVKYAFRNVLRNKKRSFLTILAIFFAAFIVMMSQGMISGMLDYFVKNFVNFQTGNVRITTEEFVKRERFMPVDSLVYGSDELIQKIYAIEGVDHVNERIRFGLLLSYHDNTVESMGMGINLLTNEFKLGEKLVEGKLEDSGVYIGVGLAKKLGVGMGEEILMATKTSEGGLNAIKLPVTGIFKTTIDMFDANVFFLSSVDAKRLLKVFGATTEIYVFTKKTDMTEKVQAEIKKILPPGVVALNYKESIGPLYSLLEQMRIIFVFAEAIILFLASFVIINTMMMAIFERMQEIGTLKAMGMTQRDLFNNFTLEGAYMGLIGGILGTIVGFIAISIIGTVGLDMGDVYKGMEFPIESVLRVDAKWTDFVVSLMVSIFIPPLAAMIPARFAGRLTPAEALRK
ncbi:MAG: ABC transporter permease [Brevinematales bacterium]|nr:ABC transporter permease [Brevinematales bacterium]